MAADDEKYILQLRPQDAQEMHGVYLAPDGNCTEQFFLTMVLLPQPGQ